MLHGCVFVLNARSRTAVSRPRDALARVHARWNVRMPGFRHVTRFGCRRLFRVRLHGIASGMGDRRAVLAHMPSSRKLRREPNALGVQPAAAFGIQTFVVAHVLPHLRAGPAVVETVTNCLLMTRPASLPCLGVSQHQRGVLPSVFRAIRARGRTYRHGDPRIAMCTIPAGQDKIQMECECLKCGGIVMWKIVLLRRRFQTVTFTCSQGEALFFWKCKG